MHTTRLQQGFFLVFLAGILLLAFFVFQPYLVVLAVSAMTAVVLNPFQAKLTKLLRGHNGWAALLTVLFFSVLLLLPLAIIGTQVFREARELYIVVRDNQAQYLNVIEDAILVPLRGLLPEAALSTTALATGALGVLTDNLGAIFSGTATILLDLLLALIALFYFLRDGERFANSFMALSPLQDRYDRRIIDRLTLAVNSVLRGQLMVAVIQGFLTGIGFFVFGIPNPALWGSLAAICALVPGVGTSLVIVPGIVYLWLTGHPLHTLGLTLWGSLAVGLIDNFLGPTLIGHGVKVHPVWILFGVLGGISLFGPMGFILGPIVVSLLFALFEIYQMIMA